MEKRGRPLDVHRIFPRSEYTLRGCVAACIDCHHKKVARAPHAVIKNHQAILIDDTNFNPNRPAFLVPGFRWPCKKLIAWRQARLEEVRRYAIEMQAIRENKPKARAEAKAKALLAIAVARRYDVSIEELLGIDA